MPCSTDLPNTLLVFLFLQLPYTKQRYVVSIILGTFCILSCNFINFYKMITNPILHMGKLKPRAELASDHTTRKGYIQHSNHSSSSLIPSLSRGLLPLFDGPISSWSVNCKHTPVPWDYSKSLDDRDEGVFIYKRIMYSLIQDS